MITAWRGLRGDRRGVAAVEFALLTPVLLLVYLGGFEASQAVATFRKLSDMTVELANITAQYTTMSNTDVTSVEAASTQIMAPYTTSNAAIVVSEITTDANSNATVTWSVPYNGATALTKGASYTLPSGMVTASTSYILVKSTYTYTPSIGSAYIGAIPMTDQIYMLPRQSTSITYTG
jgi:Flp pilus assembly protein TadG